MALFNISNRIRHDPLSFVTRRSLRPLARQTDLMLRQKVAFAEDLYTKDFVGHFGCVNAIEFSHGNGQFIASGGDDRRVLLWNVEKALSDVGKPAVMRGEHNSNIFCVAFDINNNHVLSGGNDEQVIVHDLVTGETKDVFTHEDAVYGLSPDPTNPSVFASSCDDGRVLIYDIRDSCADPFCLANYTSSMHSVMYNPVEPRLLATANAKEGVALWDVRKPRSCIMRYGGSFVQQSCMSVRFNQRGDQLIALRRRLPPVLYKLHSPQPVCEFDHSGYYNSCTMKSISYAGDNDQYVLSGSDEFNLYMWAIPEDLSERAYINSAHLVLKGHRSIVNQVRFNPANHLIISSGVEKIIKVWSPFSLPSRATSTSDTSFVRERPVYSHEEYINLVLQDGHVMSHDYSHESTDEDPRMMAFFDSLVQRELEGWSSDDSLSSNEEELFSRIVQLSQSDIDSDVSLDEPTIRSPGDEQNFSPFTIAFASVMASQGADGNDRFPRLNEALSNAEREASESNRTETTEDKAAETTEETNEELSASEIQRRRDITEMVKRKKKELKETIQRRLRDCKAKVSSSSESDTSDSEAGTEDDKPKSGKLNKFSVPDLGSPSDINLPSWDERDSDKEKTDVIKAILGCKKQAMLRIKKLRNLRRNILYSDSDSDVEIGEKKITLGAPASSTVSCETSATVSCEATTEKVQFKKLSKGRGDNKSSGSKEYFKSSSSPDRGPFIQKKAVSLNTNTEVRTSLVEENSHKKGKSSMSQSQKGKKLRIESKHKFNADSSKSKKSDKYLSFEEQRLQRRTKSAEYERSDFKTSSKLIDNDKPSCAHSSKEKRELDKKKRRHTHDHDDIETKRIKCSDGFIKKDKESERRDRIESSCLKHDKKVTSCDKDKVKHNKGSVSENSRDKHKDSKYKNKDIEEPSCSYSKDSENMDSDKCKKYRATEKVRSRRENSESSDEDDAQPTWMEFKRFRNKLERARKHYRDHKRDKPSKRHYSDDDI